jgi:hypothetical protein
MRNLADKVHVVFNKIERFSFPFLENFSSIPDNGIYLFFERGEKYNELDRIVRVGTNTGEGNLTKRLVEHFMTENKNRSIFRKNIGRAFLHKENNPYLKYWNYDTTSKANSERYLKLLDVDFETKLEKRISDYIQKNITFCILKMETKEERFFWESKIISTLAQSGIASSNDWLGNYSPIEKIRESGLWQVQNHKSPRLTSNDIDELESMI